MAHSYTFQTPEVLLDWDIIQFFEDFYRISDTPGDHDNYVDQFAEDATFVAGPKRNQGHAEIMQQRLSMWDLVKERQHTVHKLFPFGNDSTEFMLHGRVKYVFKTGDTKEVEWAGRAELVKSPSGAWKFKVYHIWL